MTTAAATPTPAGSDAPVSDDVLLGELRGSRRREAAEAARQMVLAVAHAHAHTVTTTGDGPGLPGMEQAVQVAGPGTPLVAEFAVVEFAAVMGLSLRAGTAYLGAALELVHRLPRTWQQLLDGRVAAWRARRIAEATMSLPVDGATWVDQHIAPHAGTLGGAALDRLVQEAIVRFDPETAAEQAAEQADQRTVQITVEPASLGAPIIGRVDAVLDAADALELEAAVAALAADLARAGSTEPVSVRRARALGYLARQQPVLSVDPTDRHTAATSCAGGLARQVMLHVRLNETALHGCGDGLATVTSPAGRLYGQVTVEQVQDWCATPHAHVTVQPILDLADHLDSAGYQPSARLRAQVTAINPTCVFPHCPQPSAALDLDHIQPHHRGGPTNTDNLAPLCRTHYRAKTFADWRYTPLGVGNYLWTSPHHHHWTTNHTGTRDTDDP